MVPENVETMPIDQGRRWQRFFSRFKNLLGVSHGPAMIGRLAGVALLYAALALGQPRLFFTDLDSGPNSGGENDNGVWVTVYGDGLGDAQASSTITVGGGAVATDKNWGAPWLWYQRISFQLGADAQSGDIVVHTSAGDSNPLPFVVRRGKIYFVSPGGNDAGPGTFSRPWATVRKANSQAAAGDTIYLRDGVRMAEDGGYDAVLSLRGGGGTAGNPIAFVAYPGEKAIIGDSSLNLGAIRTPNLGQGASWYTFAGLTVIGGNPGAVMAFDLGAGGSSPKSNHYRVVANDVSAPKALGNFQGGAIHTSKADFVYVYGNYVHDVAAKAGGGSTKGMHNIYFSTDSNHIWVAWNEVDGTLHRETNSGNACRGVQFHSSPTGAASDGFNQFDLHVHDNYIHDTHCDGINFATVDPSQGAVEAYNNLLVRNGTGVLTGEPSNYACIFVAGGTNAGSPGGGTVETYNNTLYDCGAAGGSDAAAVVNKGQNTNLLLNIRNTITQVIAPVPYLGGNPRLIKGSNNLWFGNGSGPAAGFTSNINADPMFVSAANRDFRLRPGSPAAGLGVLVVTPAPTPPAATPPAPTPPRLPRSRSRPGGDLIRNP